MANKVRMSGGQFCTEFGAACQVLLAYGQGLQKETSPFKVSGSLALPMSAGTLT